MTNIFDRLKPDFVVTTSSPRSEAAALHVARSKKIPTLAMVDLFGGLPGYTLEADHATFFNKLALQKSIDQGFVDPAQTKCHILGNPAFDQIFEHEAKIFNEQYDALNSPKVLFADMPGWLDTTANTSYIKNMEETLTEIEKVAYQVSIAGGTLIVKPHPSQDFKTIEGHVKKIASTIMAPEENI